MALLFSHRRHGPPFVDAIVELDRVLAPTWLVRRAHLEGVIQDERLTHPALQRAAGRTRARATIAVSGGATLFIDTREIRIDEGEIVIAPRGTEVLCRCTDATFLELEWDPDGSLGPANTAGETNTASEARVSEVRVQRRALRRSTRDAVADLTALLRDAAPSTVDGIADATRHALALLGAEGTPFDVDGALADLRTLASPDEQELNTAIDAVLSDLSDGPRVVSLEDRLGCSRRTILRRTQALCARYLMPGLAADDWRSVRDSYRLLIGAIFATHPTITASTLAAMLGYTTPEALCHAFANAGLPSPSALRAQLRTT